MKKSTFFIALILGVLFTYSCQKDIPDVTLENDKVESRHLVVQDWEPPGPCEASNFIIYISENCIDLPWEEAIYSAAQAYNDAGASIHFEITTDISVPADITFRCEVLNNVSLYGLGEWPSEDHQIGATIYLNGFPYLINSCGEPFSACSLQGIVMHEIGHNLGLGHNEDSESDQWAIGPFIFLNGELYHVGSAGSGIHIPETPEPGTNDPGSIMNETIPDCNQPCVFNENDLIALHTLYPTLIEGPDVICYGERFAYCLSGEYEGDWTVSSNLAITREGNLCIEVVALSNSGTATITYGCETKTITITDNAPCEIPSSPPIDIAEICYRPEPYCYPLNPCLESLDIQSSSENLNIYFSETEICIETLEPISEYVTLNIAPIGYCGDGTPQQWTIYVDGSGLCSDKEGDPDDGGM